MNQQTKRSHDDEYHPYLYRAMDDVRSYLYATDRKFGRHLPNELHHYTTLSSFEGIVSSGTIWASQLDHMNDETEIKLAYQVLKQGIDHKLRLAPLFKRSKLEIAFLTALKDHLGRASFRTPIFYSASFCESDNLLSQWRAYAKGVEEGLCITFSPYQMGTPDHATLISVIYGTSQNEKPNPHKEIVGKFLDSYFLEFLTMRAEASHTSLDVFANRSIDNFGQLAPHLKHADYFEEREWRLVIAHDQLQPNHVVKAGAGRRSAPYVEFRLRESYQTDVGLPMYKVVIGPHPMQDDVVSRVRNLIRGTRYEGIEIRKSATPFRW